MLMRREVEGIELGFGCPYRSRATRSLGWVRLDTALQYLSNSCAADVQFGRFVTRDMMSACNGQGVNHRNGSKHCQDGAGELHDLEMRLTVEGGSRERGCVGKLEWMDAGRLYLYTYSGFETLCVPGAAESHLR